MREGNLLISVFLAASCQGGQGDVRSDIASCASTEIAPACSLAPIAITATVLASAPAVVAGTTYVISHSGGVGYVMFTPPSSGTYTLYFSTSDPVRVCDLTPTCASVVSDCPAFERAEQYSMDAGAHYEIEVREDLLLQITAPTTTTTTTPIVFAAALDGQAEPDLYTIGSDGTGLVRLTDTPGGELYPTWSPDRSRIAFVRGFQLFLIDANGTNERLLAAQTGRARTDNGNVYNITRGPAAWSPDGARLAYLYPRPPHFVDVGNTTPEIVDEAPATMIHIITADGLSDQPLANDPGFTINSLAWAPDGTLSFSQADDCPDCAGGQFYGVIQPDGSRYQQLSGPDKNLDWSPDGSRWVYVGGFDYSSYESQDFMFTRDAFATEETQLSPDPGWNPRWSPDATAVVFLEDDGIYFINADGTNEHLLLAAPDVHGLDW